MLLSHKHMQRWQLFLTLTRFWTAPKLLADFWVNEKPVTIFGQKPVKKPQGLRARHNF
jgi:hypothetical protein